MNQTPDLKDTVIERLAQQLGMAQANQTYYQILLEQQQAELTALRSQAQAQEAPAQEGASDSTVA